MCGAMQGSQIHRSRNLRCQWPRWSRVDILPISPETTLLRTKWLVHKDAVEGENYELEKSLGWCLEQTAEGASLH